MKGVSLFIGKRNVGRGRTVGSRSAAESAGHRVQGLPCGINTLH